MDDGRRYWAFLSYSHKDRRAAEWLHRALESYVTPRRLVGRATAMGPAPRRFRPIFRDRDDLSADADLRQRVREALAQSAFLIVVCSPDAARSSWVNDEIVQFKALHGETRVLAVILSGTPRSSEMTGREDEECFPPALRVHVGPDGALTGERADPIAADLRPGHDGRRLARLKILARMLEVGLDELIRRDAQRRQAQLVAFAGVSAGVAVAMGALALAALAARNEARDQRAQAEHLVEFMLGDLVSKLKPEGRLDVLGAVGDEAMTYYARQARHGMDADALGRRARVLHLLGEIDETRGDLTSALRRFEEARLATAELLAREPDNPQRIFEHAQSVYYVGEIADRRGEEPAAEARFLEYKHLAERLVAKDPRNDNWLAEVSDADSSLGTVLAREGRTGPASTAFLEALRISKILAARNPTDRNRRWELAEAYAWVADADLDLGRPNEALVNRSAERAIYLKMLASSPVDNVAAYDLVINDDKIAGILAVQGQRRAAADRLAKALEEADRLVALQPRNTKNLEAAVQVREDLAQVLLDGRGAQSARPIAERARTDSEALARVDPTVEFWNGVLLGRSRVLMIQISEALARSESDRRNALASATVEADRLALLSAKPYPDVRLLRTWAAALILAGDYQALAGATDRARADWLRAAETLSRAGDDDPLRAGQPGRLMFVKTSARLAGSSRNKGGG